MPRKFCLGNSCYIHTCSFLRPYDCNALFDELTGISYTLLNRRKVAHFGTASYSYGSIHHIPNVCYPKLLSRLWKSIECLTKSRFNSCIVTLYENGSCYIPFHQDNEPCLGHAPTIPSFSIGATRTFMLRECSSQRLVKFCMTSGTLLIMYGAVQSFWEHSVPVEDCLLPRINVTFRSVS